MSTEERFLLRRVYLSESQSEPALLLPRRVDPSLAAELDKIAEDVVQGFQQEMTEVWAVHITLNVTMLLSSMQSYLFNYKGLVCLSAAIGAGLQQ